VQTMARIAEENEQYLIPEIIDSIQLEDRFVTDAMTNAAFELALSSGADKVIVMSQTGTTARMISRYNLPTEIIAFVSDDLYKRQLQLTKNVIAHKFMKKYTDRTKAIEYMIDFSLKNKYIKRTDKIVILGNASKDYSKFPNAFEFIDLKEYFKN
ncbi:hypothetical protein KC909_01095, partial [Candidatus Dojkabacteria bacterium]|nr:hypothetical protein [Candidatus Dojkabacteria bacterium]